MTQAFHTRTPSYGVLQTLWHGARSALEKKTKTILQNIEKNPIKLADSQPDVNKANGLKMSARAVLVTQTS